MNIKILINSILVIFLLHLIIKNIKFSKTFYFDTFKSSNISNVSIDDEKSMQFLMDTEANLENYVNNDNKCYNELNDNTEKCTDFNIKPGNYYPDNENSPNFMSNVMNLNKFYDIDNNNANNCNNYDGMNVQDLSKIQYNHDEIKNQTCFPKRNDIEMSKNAMPDNWNYKNELPMNGGNIVGNVVGFDSLNTGFASYADNQILINPNCENTMNCNQPRDDIRFGLGYPNAESRDTE
jgi:hypothetical protein